MAQVLSLLNITGYIQIVFLNYSILLIQYLPFIFMFYLGFLRFWRSADVILFLFQIILAVI